MSAEPTTLVAPDGRRYDVPAAGVATLKAKGFRDLNESETKDLELQKKYGEGVLPAVGAAASGAASALTFGGSDLALAQTPLAEANREVAERNPTAHTVGQVAAIAAPVIGELGGASAAATAAKAAGTGITAVGKASNAIGQGARAVTEAVGLKSVAPIVGGAVQAGAEGAAFQVGANLGEAARRDAKLDAETLLAHTGEAAILGAGIGAAIPVAGKVTKWTAGKALAGIEQGVQGLRALGFKGADLAVDAVDAGAGAVARNADAIGGAIQSGATGAAGVIDKGVGAIADKADAIGGALEGAGQKIARASDEHLLPRIRAGLSEQTGRPDVINDVFATGPEGQALRRELGPETVTGTREVQAEKLGEALNPIWQQSLDNAPMFDDLALAVKKDVQAGELANAPLDRATHSAALKSILTEAQTTLATLGKYNGTAKTYFEDALKDFAKTALTKRSSESLYMGLDGLKSATDKIAKFAKGAELGDTGAAFAAEEARRFRTFAKGMLEDTNVWGSTGQIQQEVNAAYAKWRRSFDGFEKQFASAKAKGQPMRLLDGAKIQKWARDITGPAGQVRNAVVDDLIEAQTELVALTERMAKRSQEQALAQLHAGTASPAILERAANVVNAPEAVSDVLNRSAGMASNLAGVKATATKALDRAEVLQQTQSAILSRQGAGVNPLPVDLAQKIGGGALVGGLIGGVPGAVVGGGITSVLQKYGAITSNPKSAIAFLNTVDRLRGVDKERVAAWIKATLGASPTEGARKGIASIAAKVDGKKIAASVRRGAEATQDALPAVREAIGSGNKATAKRILEARGAAERGIESLASKLDAATPGIMRRILPAVSYADVTNSTPDEWWARTQKAITKAQADPDALAERLQRDVAGIADLLPEQAAEISAQQMRVLGYLADRMPRNPRPYMLGDRTWTPDRGETKAYRDLVLVATKPDTLLPLITIGTATRAQVDAVRTLWPKKFEEMKTQVVNAVVARASEGHPVPYQARIRLGQLLGTPLDASQEPGFAAWMQTDTAPAPAEQRKPALGNLDLNSDAGLPMSIKTAERK